MPKVSILSSTDPVAVKIAEVFEKTMEEVFIPEPRAG